LVPISVLACGAGRLCWTSIPLVLIMLLIWLPQPLLTNIGLAGGWIDIATPGFILGAASVKFYALLAVFGLGIATFHAQCRKAAQSAGSKAKNINWTIARRVRTHSLL